MNKSKAEAVARSWVEYGAGVLRGEDIAFS